MALDYAQYGISPYGTARYGKAPVSDLALSEFTAVADGYTGIRVHWGIAVGAWTRLRLLRGAYGFAIDELDGQLLLDAVAGDGYVDTDVTSLRFYYYSLFLQQPDGTWVRAGDVVCLLPKDYGTADRLYELVPQIFRDGDDTYTISTPQSPNYGEGMLETFLSLFGDMTDTLRSELETLLWVNDPLKMSGGLLPMLAAELGIPYEAELGMAQVRRQLTNIVHLYKIKGTEPGIEGAVYAFSGWVAKASAEVNRMLSNDDASFEFGIGRWYEYSNVSLSHQTLQGLLPTSGAGYMIMTAATAGTMEGRLPAVPPALPASLPLLLNQKPKLLGGPPALPLLLGGTAPVQFLPSSYGTVLPDAITSPPVVSLPLLLGGSGGQPYTFSAYFQPVTTVRNVFVRLLFFDQNNVLVGSANGTPISEIDTTHPVRATVTATAPATARYAGFALVVQSAVASEQHKVDALQFEAGTTATTWIAANGVKITLLADRVNLSDNPSFEISTANWTPIGCTFTRATPASPYVGTAVGQVSTTAGVRVAGIQSDVIPVTAGLPYVFSANWMAVATARPVINTVTWYNAGGQAISSTASGPVAGMPLLFNPLLPASDATAVWTPVPLIAYAPTNAVSCRFTTAVMVPTGTFGAGERHYVDGVLIEQTDTVGAYFDASTGIPLADYRWEGATHLSRSHYYHRRAVRESRLTVRIPDFLPAGSSYRILDAQPV